MSTFAILYHSSGKCEIKFIEHISSLYDNLLVNSFNLYIQEGSSLKPHLSMSFKDCAYLNFETSPQDLDFRTARKVFVLISYSPCRGECQLFYHSPGKCVHSSLIKFIEHLSSLYDNSSVNYLNSCFRRVDH
jgi:hypothetical protein